MEVQQLFYTSCKKGLSSGMGFQTYSMSKGITEEERKEIESHCVYVPQDNLPTQPSEEEIEKLFPVAFSSFKLKSGKYCICQAKYVGKDYSGRYGNYFCHVFVSKEPWPFYPIELYGSMSFRNKLIIEEKDEAEVNYLPELEEIHLGNIISFNTVSKFVKGTEARKSGKAFRELMSAVIDYNSEGKKLIICDDNQNIPYWIGAIQMSLTKKLAQEVSFTTYCYNPEYADYLLCATDRDVSKTNFNDNKNLYKYNIFNFIDDDKKSDYHCSYTSIFTKLAEIGYTVSKEVFLPFIDFLDDFNYNMLNRDIDNCVCLYNIVKKGISKSSIEDVKKAIDFAINYETTKAYSQIFEQLEPNLESISTQVDIELTELITKFLFNMGRKTGENKHIEEAYKFFFSSIHYLVIDVEDIKLEDILKLYDKMRNYENVGVVEFTKESLQGIRIKQLRTFLEGGKARHAKFYFKSVIDDIIIFNDKCSKSNNLSLNIKSEDAKNITLFLNECLSILIKFPKDMIDVLNSLKYEYEYLSDIIIRAYSINKCIHKSNSAEEALADFMIDEGNKDKQWKIIMYTNISKLSNANNFFFTIYNFELRKNGIKDEFFINYCFEIFDLFKEYRGEKFSQALASYLDFSGDNISLEEYKEIVDYIYKNLLIEVIDKSVLKTFFSNFENKIDIGYMEVEEIIIEKAFEIKKRQNIKTPCSIVEIIYAGNKIQDSKSRITFLVKQKIDFSSMNSHTYEEYLKWLLPDICLCLQDYSEHGKVKKALFCVEHANIYYKQYMDTMEDITFDKRYINMLNSYYKEGYEIFLDFVIFIFKNSSTIDNDIEKYVKKRIIDILKKVSAKKMEIYNNYFVHKMQYQRNKAEILTMWTEVMEEAKDRSHKSNLFGLF